MEMLRQVWFWAAVVTLCAALNGCAQSQPAGSTLAADQPKTILGNPAELVNQLSAEISQARMDQINLLAPGGFKRAESAFFNAQRDLEKGREISDIRKSVLESRAHLRNAEEIANVSRLTLSDTLEARGMALSAGAATFEQEYRRVENDFLDLTRAIERDNLSYAQRNRSRVTERYRELEVRAIQEETLGDVRARIAQAETADARRIAPVTHGQAVDQLDAAEAFISANPYATEAMYAMAKQALFQANRLVVITSQINHIRTLTPEEMVLLMEKHLHTLSAELGVQDMRDQDYQIQLENIVGSVNALKSDRTFLSEQRQTLQAEMEAIKSDSQAQIDALNLRVATLESKSLEERMLRERMAKERTAVEQRLAAEKAFNQRFMAVQNYFDPDEAEVYNQENQLILRLKAMQFPVGQNIILPANYPLLSKVQKAVRTFDNPRVVVEGHTDATGSDEVNMLLSQQRAESVRNYLIANQTLTPEAITALGYGSERPLASNATAAGRAVNRRIDILIIPPAKPF